MRPGNATLLVSTDVILTSGWSSGRLVSTTGCELYLFIVVVTGIWCVSAFEYSCLDASDFSDSFYAVPGFYAAIRFDPSISYYATRRYSFQTCFTPPVVLPFPSVLAPELVLKKPAGYTPDNGYTLSASLKNIIQLKRSAFSVLVIWF